MATGWEGYCTTRKRTGNRQAGRQGSGRGLVLGTQGNPDRKPGAWQLPDHRYPSKFPMSPSERIPRTNPGRHRGTTGGRRMLSRVWGGSERTRRAGLPQRYKVTFSSTPKLSLLHEAWAPAVGPSTKLPQPPAKPKGNRQGGA